MYLRSNVVLIMGVLLAVILLRPILACADTEIQGRPTRPKEFDNVGDLNDYLNLVKDYYILKGKARYGKRTGLLRNIIETPNYSRELLRSKLNGLQKVFETIQSNAAEKKKSNPHAFSQDHYSEDDNNLRIPYQISHLKLSQNSNILKKSDGSRK